MSQEERMVENIKTTMAVEGLFLQDQDVSLIMQFLNKEITEEQGIDMIKSDILSQMR